MKPFDVNPLTKIWRVANANILLAGRFPTYLKLVEIVVVMILGLIENKRTFSSLTFLKPRLCNALDGHLSMVVCMYSQKLFNLELQFLNEEAYLL